MTALHAAYPFSYSALEVERPRLVGLCARLTGEIAVAEDLAQETLIEAWRHRHRLRDPDGSARWLSAIARNVCRRWQRAHGLALSRQATSAEHFAVEALPDKIDLERDLEQAELAALLDRALARLPPLTRAVLIGRYIAGTPVPELASRLGLSRAVIAKRLQRGIIALRVLLDEEFQLSTAPGAWQQTRIWCMRCGSCRLLGRLSSDGNRFALRCTGCDAHDATADVSIQGTGLFSGIRTIKPALSRVLEITHRRHAAGMTPAAVPCLGCGRPTVLQSGQDNARTNGQAGTVLVRRCGACGTFEHTSLAIRAFAVPEVQRFWRAHPRLRILPECPIEAVGSQAAVITFQSVSSADHFDLVALQSTGQVLSLDGRPYRE